MRPPTKLPLKSSLPSASAPYAGKWPGKGKALGRRFFSHGSSSKHPNILYKSDSAPPTTPPSKEKCQPAGDANPVNFSVPDSNSSVNGGSKSGDDGWYLTLEDLELPLDLEVNGAPGNFKRAPDDGLSHLPAPGSRSVFRQVDGDIPANYAGANLRIPGGGAGLMAAGSNNSPPAAPPPIGHQTLGCIPKHYTRFNHAVVLNEIRDVVAGLIRQCGESRVREILAGINSPIPMIHKILEEEMHRIWIDGGEFDKLPVATNGSYLVSVPPPEVEIVRKALLMNPGWPVRVPAGTVEVNLIDLTLGEEE